MKRSIKVALAVTLGVAALILNPWFGATSGYHYGASDMRAAIEGTWRLTVTPADQPRRELTFRIAQGTAPIRSSSHGWVRSAAACGHRSLVKNAEACMDFSEMPLEITVLDGDQPGRTTGVSRFEVTGTTFERGSLDAEIAGLWVSGHISPMGEASGVMVGEHDGPLRDAPATLQRIAR